MYGPAFQEYTPPRAGVCRQDDVGSMIRDLEYTFKKPKDPGVCFHSEYTFSPRTESWEYTFLEGKIFP